MAIEYTTRRFTIDEYEHMARIGIIGPDEKVELIEGEIVTVPPMGEDHGTSISRGNEALVVRFYGRALILPQLPVALGQRSMPEPDFGIVRYEADHYRGRRVRESDIFAIIESSDSRLAFDRGPKLLMYARARIPEYWIVNIPEDLVEVHRAPHDLGYAAPIVLRRGERLGLLAFPDDPISADDLLP